MKHTRQRGHWEGMLTIARFNWPYYLVAAVVLLVAIVTLTLTSHAWFQLAALLVIAGCLYFLLGSLGVSHWIYDRSDLYRWTWLSRALGDTVLQRALFCHSGFDESSSLLCGQLGKSTGWTVLDHFDECRMTEPSIRRARRLYPPTPDTVAAPYDRWPVDARSADVVFGLLAIHELRSESERTAWFTEAKRCLQPAGRVVLVEHVRDLANFIAFGPGFLHFHSPTSWRRCWEAAGFRRVDEFCITPFVRVFVLQAA